MVRALPLLPSCSINHSSTSLQQKTLTGGPTLHENPPKEISSHIGKAFYDSRAPISFINDFEKKSDYKGTRWFGSKASSAVEPRNMIIIYQPSMRLSLPPHFGHLPRTPKPASTNPAAKPPNRRQPTQPQNHQTGLSEPRRRTPKPPSLIPAKESPNQCQPTNPLSQNRSILEGTSRIGKGRGKLQRREQRGGKLENLEKTTKREENENGERKPRSET
ncbi:hypothetical protein LR48_Vigan08g040500 [Vigna angularis]|uniref:Uncharacterized protein n=1 Tax=Phaseolus angularis TaxID=3914 RepID=A0A0L9V3F8_PHAAN|nr:hypothetical protein LR48_Vigan08g040500 [Vigna angularis]